MCMHLPNRSDAGGARPEGVGARGDAVGEFFIDGVEGVEEGLRFGFEAEQERGAEDAGEAEMIVVHRPEPVLRAVAEVGGALDGEAGGSGDLLESVEAEHALEGLAQPLLHGDRTAEDTDGEGIEDGRGGIGAAGLGKGKEPLDEIVHGFEVIVVPGKNLGEGAAFIIALTVAVERDEWMDGGRLGQRWIQPFMISSSEVAPTTTHKSTPWTSGRATIFLRVRRESSDPIRNRVTRRPSRPRRASCV